MVTFVIKRTFYLQNVKVPKVTLGIPWWILNEHSMQLWGKKKKKKKNGAFLKIHLRFQKNHIFCVQLYGKWVRWGRYNLYLETFKGSFFKNVLILYLIFAENVTLLSLNI